MAIQVVSGAVLACSFGAAPSALTVLPVNRVTCSNMPAATIMDYSALVNVAPFGMCRSPDNPAVAAATAAALGVLTPQPCVPATTTPWAPGTPTVTIGQQPALDNVSTCRCMWGGVINVVSAGQVRTTVP